MQEAELTQSSVAHKSYGARTNGVAAVLQVHQRLVYVPIFHVKEMLKVAVHMSAWPYLMAAVSQEWYDVPEVVLFGPLRHISSIRAAVNLAWRGRQPGRTRHA